MSECAVVAIDEYDEGVSLAAVGVWECGSERVCVCVCG